MFRSFAPAELDEELWVSILKFVDERTLFSAMSSVNKRFRRIVQQRLSFHFYRLSEKAVPVGVLMCLAKYSSSITQILDSLNYKRPEARLDHYLLLACTHVRYQEDPTCPNLSLNLQRIVSNRIYQDVDINLGPRIETAVYIALKCGVIDFVAIECLLTFYHEFPLSLSTEKLKLARGVLRLCAHEPDHAARITALASAVINDIVTVDMLQWPTSGRVLDELQEMLTTVFLLVRKLDVGDLEFEHAVMLVMLRLPFLHLDTKFALQFLGKSFMFEYMFSEFHHDGPQRVWRLYIRWLDQNGYDINDQHALHGQADDVKLKAMHASVQALASLPIF